MPRQTDPYVSECVAKMGARIRELRKARGMTCEELGEASVLTKEQVTRIENGQGASSFTIADTARIAAALNVPHYYLYAIGDHELVRVVELLWTTPMGNVRKLKRLNAARGERKG